MFQHSRMAEEINAGRDVHCILAADIAGVPYDTAVAGVQADDSFWKEKRQVAKSANFGLWGGMRERRFTALLKANSGQLLEINVVKHIRQTWLRTWPEAAQYLEWHERACATGFAKITQYKSNRERGRLTYSQACNTRFQGLIADATKAAGWALAEEMYNIPESVLFGSRIVNYPHDEFIIEVPEEKAHECAMRIGEIVIHETGAYLPDVPPRASPYLTRYWSKKAKAIWQNGRLVPWPQ
jgi:DNA polymerase I-like protein with 3'-5' exonuclease and polymerase domains